MSRATGKDALLLWCKKNTAGYKDVKVENFTTSWKDGLAFCALIHKFCGSKVIDFDSLKKTNAEQNLSLAFSIADTTCGIPALLDVEDIVNLPVPEMFSIITYLSQYYHRFEGGKPSGSGVASISVDPSSDARRAVDSSNRQKMRENEERIKSWRKSIQTALPVTKECARCRRPIDGDTVELRGIDKVWHKSCFSCYKCNGKIGQTPVLIHDQLHCTKCGDEPKKNVDSVKPTPKAVDNVETKRKDSVSPALPAAAVNQVGKKNLTEKKEARGGAESKHATDQSTRVKDSDQATVVCPSCRLTVGTTKYCRSCGAQLNGKEAEHKAPAKKWIQNSNATPAPVNAVNRAPTSSAAVKFEEATTDSRLHPNFESSKKAGTLPAQPKLKSPAEDPSKIRSNSSARSTTLSKPDNNPSWVSLAQKKQETWEKDPPLKDASFFTQHAMYAPPKSPTLQRKGTETVVRPPQQTVEERNASNLNVVGQTRTNIAVTKSSTPPVVPATRGVLRRMDTGLTHSVPAMEGWLQLRSDFKLFSSWRDRWFKLQGDTLAYWTTMEKKNMFGRDVPPKGTISLLHIKEIKPDLDSRINEFSVVTEEMTYAFRTPTTETMFQWIEVIGQAMIWSEGQRELARQKTMRSNFGPKVESKEGLVNVRWFLGLLWVERWVTLKGGVLFFFHTNNGKKGQPSGKFALFGATMAEYGDDGRAFELRSDKGSVVIQTQDEEEMQRWLNVIVRQQIEITETIDSIVI